MNVKPNPADELLINSIESFIILLLKMFPVLEKRLASIISLFSFFNTVLTLIVPNLNSSPSETDNIISKLLESLINWAIDEVNLKFTNPFSL